MRLLTFVLSDSTRETIPLKPVQAGSFVNQMNYFWQVTMNHLYSQAPDPDLCQGQTTDTAQDDHILDLVYRLISENQAVHVILWAL